MTEQGNILNKNRYDMNVKWSTDNPHDQYGTFSTISRYEKILTICFFLAVFAILLQVPGSVVLKYVALPLTMLMLFKTDIFNYLIFPISFTENIIGTMIFGKFTLIWFYFPLLFFKWFAKEKKKVKMTLPYFLMLTFFSIYQILAYSEYGMNSIKSILFIFCSIIVVEECRDNREKYEKIFWVVVLSSIIQALALAFSLTGITIESSERTTGIGFEDPNYAAFIVLIGFCILLNMSTKAKKMKIVQIVGCLLCCLAVFRSGSRSGMAVCVCIMLARIVLIKGASKKSKYILGLTIVASIVTILISSGTIKIPGYELIIERLTGTFDAYRTGNYLSATAGRSTIAQEYIRYCFSRSIIGVLFGGTVVASSNLLSQIGYVTHNVYLDYLLAFGVVGAVFLIGNFAARGFKQLNLYRKTGDINMLTMVEIKICMLVFGFALAFLRVNMWWFLFVL